MRRREFTVGLASAIAWPLAARAQQNMRRIGLLMGIANDAEGQGRVGAFRETLQQLGWLDGRNIRFDDSWGSGDAEHMTAEAKRLIGLGPDVILANSTLVASRLKRETSSIPIVFVQVADPIGSGIVPSLAHPGGNITGFTSYEFAMGGKWLATLKEVAPHLTRVALLHNPQDSNWPGFLQATEQVAATLHVQVVPADAREEGALEASITALAREPNSGLIVLPTTATNLHRKLIIALAAEHRLPTIYPFRYNAAEGGLLSYGFDTQEPYRLAAAYVDRLLKGEKPADLPVQAPTRYELVVNLNAAKAIGLAIPESFLVRADAVIE